MKIEFRSLAITLPQSGWHRHSCLCLALVLCFLFGPTGHSRAHSAEAPYAVMPESEIVTRLTEWINASTGTPAPEPGAAALWKSAPALDPVSRFASVLARTSPRLGTLISACQFGLVTDAAPMTNPVPNSAAVAEAIPDSVPQAIFVAANVRLFCGKFLVLSRSYDEGLELLTGIDPRLAVDPAQLLFFRASASHQLLKPEEARADLALLLKQTTDVPARYRDAATLLEDELRKQQEKEQPLGRIAQLMSDSERRLDLGRSGEKVQEVQSEIVKSLDELIEQLEQQSQNSNSQQQPADGASQPSDDSRVKGTTGPGETEKKSFENAGKWGNLPAKEEAEAKNLINRSFPSHYQQAIEKYFRKLANRPTKN